MKAVIKKGLGKDSLVVGDMPIPAVGPGLILVQIKASAVCYTDVSIQEDRYKGRKPLPYPFVPGHEGAGVVAELGQGVTGFRIGDRVGMEALKGCGRCDSCRNGHYNMCADWEHLGTTRNGTFAEYVSIPAEMAHALPDEVSFADAACLEPIGLTVRTLEQVRPEVGETAAVIGPGSLGLFHVQAFKAAGVAKVILIGRTRNEKRFEIARELGADHVLTGSPPEVVEELKALNGGRGADIVVETASSTAAVPLAIHSAGPLGRVFLFGLYPEATFSPLHVLRNGLSIYGNVALLTRHFKRALKWVETGKVLATPIIAKRFRLEQALDAFAASRNGETIKALFEF